MSVEYEPASEPLHIYVKKLSIPTMRVIYLFPATYDVTSGPH